MLSAVQKSYLWLDSFPLERTEKHALIKAAGGVVPLVKRFAEVAQTPLAKKAETYAAMNASLQDGGKYFQGLTQTLEREGIAFLCIEDEGYPTAWRQTDYPPLCVYAKGNLSVLQERAFAIVGSRRTTESAKKIGKTIAEELSHTFVVLTGVADGGDEAAVEGALRGSGRVACMLAGGFSSVPAYAALLNRVAEKGLVFSACPMEEPVRIYSYEARNRLLAVLSVGGLVLGAAEKSGALITAKYLREGEKPLFALPYAPGAAAGVGCNALIKTGAYLTETAADILERFGVEPTERKTVALTDTEAKVLSVLQERAEAHVNELAQATGLPTFKLLTALSALELKGVAVKLGGNRFAAV